MCGIVGYLDKRALPGGPARPGNVGRVLLSMLQALGCRGPDSAGVAVLGEPAPEWTARLKMSDGTSPESVSRDYRNGVFDLRIPAGHDPNTIEADISRRLPGAEIVCLGASLNLFKQVGSPDQLEATYHVSALTGTHGIGHTRLSTESKVDLSHSQPFWAHGLPDIATVHNGHITNYHKLRRRYEQKGHRFFTENDSEVIGVYLRDRMSTGLPLSEALRASLTDFDGSFCYLAVSPEGLSMVKDAYGFKPLVLAETADFVALATEEVALRRALGSGFAAREPDPGQVRTWTVGR